MNDHADKATHYPLKKTTAPEPSTQDIGLEPVSPINTHTLRPNSIRQLQRMIGNQAVQRLIADRQNLTKDPTETDNLLSRSPAGTIQREDERPRPTWAEQDRDVRAIQRELRRLGTYRFRIDGDYGPYTDSALVEAFGGDEFRDASMDAAAVLTRLQTAQPQGDRNEHQLRYGEMFRDNVLDITVGVGHDETGWDQNTLNGWDDSDGTHHPGVLEVLQTRGFLDDMTRAQELYTQAGRAFPPGFQYLVRENALRFTPPAGEARDIHAVVRVISNTGGTDGGDAADAFREGMVQSDATFYGGHGRYGSGPDFDRNFGTIRLLAADGSEEQQVEDDPSNGKASYEVLSEVLQIEGRRYGRSPWQQFQWRLRRGRIDVDYSNAGNVFLNPNPNQSAFGSRFMQWALRQSGADVQTGRDGGLADEAQQHPDRRYRVIVFDGCNTRDYERSLRATPGMGRDSTQAFASTRSLYWSDIARTLASFLDSIIAQQSAEDIVRDMNEAQDDTQEQHGENTRSFTSSGTMYDPVHRKPADE